MILKYGGPCAKCGETIPKGTEAEYSSVTRKVSHYVCVEKKDLFSESEAEDTAARCGFIPSSAIGEGFRIPDEWKRVFLLPRSTGEPAAGRDSDSPRERPDAVWAVQPGTPNAHGVVITDDDIPF